jgi:hypothetical protein
MKLYTTRHIRVIAEESKYKIDPVLK